MKFKEIASRITGFNTPVFGVSWNPPEPEVAVARRILAYLEDRRVLFNPYHLEVASQCVDSVIRIREKLSEEIGQLSDDSALAKHLRAIRAACRRFLDSAHDKQDAYRILRPGPIGPFESEFFTSLGELRASVGLHIAAIAVMYGIDVQGELADALPAQDEDAE